MQAWNHFLLVQEHELGTDTVNRWLRTLKVVRFDACNLYLEAKDSFQANWFEEHLRKKIRNNFVNNNNTPIHIHLSVASKEKTPSRRRNKSEPAPAYTMRFDELDPSCNLDTFLVTEKNLIVHKLFSKTSGKDGEPEIAIFNPIYIHGPMGSGKTHLLMAAAQELNKHNLKSLYIRAETFTDHVINAIRAGEMHLFRNTYRNADVLLIDGVHLFSRKGATQEELFHTFNTLHLAGKQIILSSLCPPSELQAIEARLISRFEWGIVLPLEVADKPQRQRIMQQRLDMMNCQLHQKVQDFLLETFVSTTSSLCRAVEALILRSHMHGKNSVPTHLITVIWAKETLKDLIEEELKAEITTGKIVQSTAEYYGIRSEDILGKAQSRDCTLPRQIAMFLCRDLLKMPYMRIGDLFERDHSTVMSSVKQVGKSLEDDSNEIVPAVQVIRKKIRQS